MRYYLIATNEQGASQFFVGNSKISIILEFESEYDYSGFQIELVDNKTGKVDFIKKNFS